MLHQCWGLRLWRWPSIEVILLFQTVSLSGGRDSWTCTVSAWSTVCQSHVTVTSVDTIWTNTTTTPSSSSTQKNTSSPHTTLCVWMICLPANINICIPFMQCWTNVDDVGPTFYKCYAIVLYLLGWRIWSHVIIAFVLYRLLARVCAWTVVWLKQYSVAHCVACCYRKGCIVS